MAHYRGNTASTAPSPIKCVVNLRKGDQTIPPNLRAAFRANPALPEASQFNVDASQQLKDLYVADFEMARLKEMKEATLLRFYLRLEKYLPDPLMRFAGKGIKAIVSLY